MSDLWSDATNGFSFGSDGLPHPDNFIASEQSKQDFLARLERLAQDPKRADDASKILEIAQQYRNDKSGLSPADFLLSRVDPLAAKKTALVDQAYRSIGHGLAREEHPVSRMTTEMHKIIDRNRKLSDIERMELHFYADNFHEEVKGAIMYGHEAWLNFSQYTARQNFIKAIESLRTKSGFQMAQDWNRVRGENIGLQAEDVHGKADPHAGTEASDDDFHKLFEGLKKELNESGAARCSGARY